MSTPEPEVKRWTAKRKTQLVLEILKGKTTVAEGICQRKGWQVKKRIKGKRPRAKGLISVASRPNERWSTDLTRVLCGRDGWCTLAVVRGRFLAGAWRLKGTRLRQRQHWRKL